MQLKLNEETSLEDLFLFADFIKDRGHLVFVKLDGERNENHYTVIIGYPVNISREIHKYEGDNLNKGFYQCIVEYFIENKIEYNS